MTDKEDYVCMLKGIKSQYLSSQEDMVINLFEALYNKEKGYTQLEEEVRKVMKVITKDNELFISWGDIPEKIKYVVMDEDGEWFGYSMKPILKRGVWDNIHDPHSRQLSERLVSGTAKNYREMYCRP